MRTQTYWLVLALAIIMSGSALAQDTQTINGISFTLPEGYQINEQTDGLFGSTFVTLSDARTLDSPPPEQRTIVFSLITQFDNPQGLDNQAAYAQLRDGFIQNYSFTLGDSDSLEVNGQPVELQALNYSDGTRFAYIGLLSLPKDRAGILVFTAALEDERNLVEDFASSIQVSASNEVAFTVNTLDDAPNGCPDSCTLRHALALAAPGDSIGFADGLSGTINLQAPLVIDKSINIMGTSTIVLDGGNTVQLINIQGEGHLQVSLSGLTLQNGVCEFGGGALWVPYGIEALTLDGMSFQNNTCIGSGGAVAVGGTSTLIVRNSSFINNRTQMNPTETYATASGGGLNIGINDIGDNYTIVIDGSSFINNVADVNGGGLYIAAALNFYNDASVTITNSTFGGNSAQESGGGLWVNTETSLNYSTVADNEARRSGGADGYFFLNDSILSLNRSILGGEGEDFGGTILGSSGTNIIGTLTTETDDSPLVFDLRDKPLLLQLGNYGGLTQTFALAEGSPAIDRGGGSPCPSTDQRGEPRTAPCDIGAVEFTGIIDAAPLTIADSPSTGQDTSSESETTIDVIAFAALDGTTVNTINANGSNRQPIISGAGAYQNLTWSPDGRQIAFSAASDSSFRVYNIYVVNADGSNVAQITTYNEGLATNPDWSPDGTKIAYNYGSSVDFGSPTQADIYIVDAQSGTPERLGNNLMGPSWSPDGSLMAAVGLDGGGIYVLKADGSTITQISPDTPSAGNPILLGIGRLRAVEWSQADEITYFLTDSSSGNPMTALVAIKADGSQRRVVATFSEISYATSPAWSPDGSQFAFADQSGQLWLGNADGSLPQRLTLQGERVASQPAWQPMPVSSSLQPAQVAAVPTSTPQAIQATDEPTITLAPTNETLIDFSGHWEGILSQGAANFAFSMEAIQAGETISGTTRIELLDDPSQYGVISFEGTNLVNTLSFQEIEVVQDQSASLTWCVKHGNLLYEVTDEGEILSGNWDASGCEPGSIRLVRSTTSIQETSPTEQSSAATPDLVATAVAATVAALQPQATPTETPTPDLIATYVQATLDAIQVGAIPTATVSLAPPETIPFADPTHFTQLNPAFELVDTLDHDNQVALIGESLYVHSEGPWAAACYPIQPSSHLEVAVQVNAIPQEGQLAGLGLGYSNEDFSQYGDLFIGQTFKNGMRGLQIRMSGTVSPELFEETITDGLAQSESLYLKIVWENGIGSLFYGLDLQNMTPAKTNFTYSIPETDVQTQLCLGGYSADLETPIDMFFKYLRTSGIYPTVESSQSTTASIPPTETTSEVHFEADFSRNQGWEPVSPIDGSVNVRNGELLMRTIGQQAGLKVILPEVTIDPRNFSIEIETSFIPTDSDQWIGFVVGDIEADNYTAFVIGDIWDYWNYLYVDVPSAWNPLVNEALRDGLVDYNAPLNLRLEAEDGSFRLVVNGQPLPRIEVNPYGNQIGLVIFNGDCCGSRGEMTISALKLISSGDESSFAVAQPDSEEDIPIDYKINCIQTVDSLGLSEGDSAIIKCDANCGNVDTSYATVWGTAVYTSDSSICRAAIHSGNLWSEPFVLEILPGQSSYHGSVRNGIETYDYGSWNLSFSVQP